MPRPGREVKVPAPLALGPGSGIPADIMADPMATQIAGLLVDSDLEELEEIVKRWVAEAPDALMRHHYQEFGGKLIELKRQLHTLPVQPGREELEMAVDMMLKLAAQQRR